MAATLEAFETDRAGSPLGVATDITITKPAGLQNGDWLVGLMCSDSAASGSWSAPSDTVAWTEEDDLDAGDVLAAWYSKYIADVNDEPSDYTFTVANGDELCGVIVIIRGADTTTLIDVEAMTNASSSAPDSPSVTTTVDDELVLLMICLDDDDNVLGDADSPQAGLFSGDAGNDGPHYFASGNGSGHAMLGFSYMTQATAGATGTQAWALDSGSGAPPTSPERYVAYTVAIKTAPSTLFATPGLTQGATLAPLTMGAAIPDLTAGVTLDPTGEGKAAPGLTSGATLDPVSMGSASPALTAGATDAPTISGKGTPGLTSGATLDPTGESKAAPGLTSGATLDPLTMGAAVPGLTQGQAFDPTISLGSVLTANPGLVQGQTFDPTTDHLVAVNLTSGQVYSPTLSGKAVAALTAGLTFAPTGAGVAVPDFTQGQTFAPSIQGEDTQFATPDLIQGQVFEPGTTVALSLTELTRLYRDQDDWLLFIMRDLN